MRVLASVLIGLAIAVGGTAGAAPASARQDAATLTAVRNCESILFVGVRGSGQDSKSAGRGLGPEVEAVRSVLASQLPDLTMHVAPVNYTSASVDELKPSLRQYIAITGAATAPLALYDYKKTHLDPYLASVRDGTNEILKTVRARRSCTAERVVFAGCSQGAIAVHRALQELAAAGDTDILNRIDGVELIADGDRVPGSKSRVFGSPPSRAQGNGVAVWAGQQKKDVPSKLVSRTVHVCTDGDLVCDFSYKKLRSGGEIHTSYSTLSQISVATQYLAGLIRRPSGTLTWIQEASLPGGQTIERVVGSLRVPSSSLASGDTLDVDLTLTKTYPDSPDINTAVPCRVGAEVRQAVRAVNLYPDGTTFVGDGYQPALGTLNLAVPADWTSCFDTGRQVDVAHYTGPATYYAFPGVQQQTLAVCGVWSRPLSQSGTTATTICKAQGPRVTLN